MQLVRQFLQAYDHVVIVQCVHEVYRWFVCVRERCTRYTIFMYNAFVCMCVCQCIVKSVVSYIHYLVETIWCWWVLHVCSSHSTSQIYQNLIIYGYNMHKYNYLQKFFFLGVSLLFGLVYFCLLNQHSYRISIKKIWNYCECMCCVCVCSFVCLYAAAWHAINNYSNVNLKFKLQSHSPGSL